jgi:hypothetical protein
VASSWVCWVLWTLPPTGVGLCAHCMVMVHLRFKGAVRRTATPYTASVGTPGCLASYLEWACKRNLHVSAPVDSFAASASACSALDAALHVSFKLWLQLVDVPGLCTTTCMRMSASKCQRYCMLRVRSQGWLFKHPFTQHPDVLQKLGKLHAWLCSPALLWLGLPPRAAYFEVRCGTIFWCVAR